MAIAALVLWLLTGAAGIALLRTGNAARRRLSGPAPAASRPARIAAIPLTAEGKPPPVPHPKVTAPPGEHPLLEFTHPALALIGTACWFLFTFIHYQPLAWISLGVLLVTIGAGLGWLTVGTLAARRPGAVRRTFPSRLAVLHGLAAAVTVALAVVAALAASRR